MSDDADHGRDHAADIHALIERHLQKELRLQVEMARAERAESAASAAVRKARHALGYSSIPRWDGVGAMSLSR